MNCAQNGAFFLQMVFQRMPVGKLLAPKRQARLGCRCLLPVLGQCPSKGSDGHEAPQCSRQFENGTDIALGQGGRVQWQL